MPDDPEPDKGKDKPDPTDKDEVEKWKSLARKHEAQAKANADAAKKLEELENAGKSDLDKANAATAAAERRADVAEAKLLRFEVAAEKGVKPRWLSGDTREELEAAADEYLQEHPPATGDGKPAPGKPVEDLKGGGDPDAGSGDDVDLRKVVAETPRF